MYHRHGAYQNTQTLPPISSYYENMGAPILPPLRIPEQLSAGDEFRLRAQQDHHSHVLQDRQQQQQIVAPKEDKATGGVSAKLDYEMERMTDFVAEAAQGIIHPAAPIQPSFRKWVLQVLTATRLPSATILLSLHYLTVRLRDFPKTVTTSENQIYRLLAVALVLGSKFLDDNTFINRSWSDVSGIRVSELNHLEMEWLHLINYDLHCDPANPSGLSSWLQLWKDYERAAADRPSFARLLPLDTNLQRLAPNTNAPSSYHQQQQYTKGLYSDFTPQPSTSGSSYSSTPYVSADPWNRPEPNGNLEPTYGSQQGYIASFDARQHCNASVLTEPARRSTHGGCALPMPHSLRSSYVSPWNQTTWAGAHPPGCNCMTCTHQYLSYLPAAGYANQTMVG